MPHLLRPRNRDNHDVPASQSRGPHQLQVRQVRQAVEEKRACRGAVRPETPKKGRRARLARTCATFRGLNQLRPSSRSFFGDVCPVGEKLYAPGYSTGRALNPENSRMGAGRPGLGVGAAEKVADGGRGGLGGSACRLGKTGAPTLIGRINLRAHHPGNQRPYQVFCALIGIRQSR